MDDLTQLTLGGNLNSGTTASSNQKDHYSVLAITPNASRLEIREAYLRMKGTYGAGSAALYSLIDEDEAARQLIDIESAFKTLNDDHLRHEYDIERGYVEPADLSRQGAFATPKDSTQVASEADRLSRMREAASNISGQVSGQVSGQIRSQVSGIGTSYVPADEGVVRTQRSTLSVIKLRATNAGSADMHEKMREIIAAHDAGDGDLYRQLRELCRVSADEMQERTKVSIGHLEAIETNRFERLPQAVYVKGFLASYFRYLDVPGYEKLTCAFAARLLDWQANKKN